MIGTSRDRAVSRVRKATAALHADIARRETVEAQLRARETELEAFAAIAAHDLKAPLASVAGHAELLEETLAPDTDGHPYLQRIQAGTARMRRLIDYLLAYASARATPLHPQPVALGTVVADIVEERTAHLTDRRPQLDVGPLPTVVADPVLLRHVMDNVTGNALKYVAHGRTAQVTIGADPDDQGWTIEVADRGIGISVDDQPHVFGTFRRVRGCEGYAGTGLGLAICERIVHRHGGSIGVRPNPGGGSIFWFTLPRAAPLPGTWPTETAQADGHEPAVSDPAIYA
ncbi:ATP-binding protein [Cryptosporangium sp. NPDC048952]|uniref:sensor histidine kinase n=1 Tax=Cryptosporangium sp. NPDC048952 TaxID=3363961 RepID=UPI003718C595